MYPKQKRFRLIHVWLALVWLWSAVALATSTEIRINLSPEAQAMLKQADPARKKQLDKAVEIGSAFIQRYLDGRAYDLDPEIYSKWEKDTGLLMTMGAKEFDEKTKAETSDWPTFNIIGTNYPPDSTGQWLACSTVELETIGHDIGNIHLTFRTQKIGYMVHTSYIPGGSIDFVAVKDAGYHSVYLTLDLNNRISSVQFSEKLMVHDYQSSVLGLQGFINDPEVWLRIGDTKETLEAAVRIKRRIIQNLNRTAAEICSH